VQYVTSSILSDFLQQAFTLAFMVIIVIALGGRLAWILPVFGLIAVGSIFRIGRDVRRTTRRGQDKLADIQNILHETITGNRIVKAFNMEFWSCCASARRRTSSSAPICARSAPRPSPRR